MTAKQCNKLIKLVKSGHIVIYEGIFEVNILNIYERDEVWYYDSTKHAEMRLDTLDESRIRVFKEVPFSILPENED